MTVLVTTETEGKTKDFLGGACTPEDFEAWIVSELESASVLAERDALWEIRLLLSEYGEGIRSLDAVRAGAVQLLREFAGAETFSDSDNETVEETIH